MCAFISSENVRVTLCASSVTPTRATGNDDVSAFCVALKKVRGFFSEQGRAKTLVDLQNVVRRLLHETCTESPTLCLYDPHFRGLNS